MAKIIYFKDLKNPDTIIRKKSEADTLGKALEDMGLDKRPNLAVRINGKSPEDLPLETPIKKNDLIEITHFVEGGGEGDSQKNTIATIVQFAALVVAAFIPGGQAAWAIFARAAIVIAGSLIAGAIRRAGFKDILKNREQDQEAASQVFSITASRNEARPLEPMNLVLGSHRLAPDYNSQPYLEYFEQTGIPKEVQAPIKNFTKIDLGNSLNPSTWQTMPAGWLSQNIFARPHFYFGPSVGTNHAQNPKNFNLWPYDLKVHPDIPFSHLVNDSNAFLIRENNLSSGRYIASWPMSFNSSNEIAMSTMMGKSGAMATPIYHSDPSDPFFGTYSNLQFIIWSVFAYYNDTTPSSSVYIKQNQLVSSSFISPNSPTYLRDNIEDIYGFLIGDQNYIANNLGGNTSITDVTSFTGQFIYERLFKNLETRSTLPNNPSNSYLFDFFRADVIRELDSTIWPYGVLSYTHNHHYFDPAGGEQRKASIWNYVQSIQNRFLNPAYLYQEIELEKEPYSKRARHVFNYGIGKLEILDRRIKNTELTDYKDSSQVLALKQTDQTVLPGDYLTNVKTEDGAELTNNTSNFSGPETVVPLSDLNRYNWIIRETPANTNQIRINITGRSFKSEDDGSFTTLLADFELQYKEKSSAVYQFSEFFQLTSYKTNLIRRTLIFNPPTAGKYDIRVRKITKDPENRKEVQDFQLESFIYGIEDDTPYEAQVREGLTLVASNKSNSQTQEYNSLVEASCWTFTGGAWVWAKTRNPAWWFLYYARGGFVNRSADGSLAVSPTIGWVNGHHEDNIERIFGSGLEDEYIDIEKIKYWADFCDSNDLKLDMVIREDSNVQEILERIANVGRASTSWYRGKLSVVVEDPTMPISGAYGMGNIIQDSFTVTYITDNLPDIIIGTYIDRNDEWKTKTVEALIPGVTDPINRVEITLTGITEEQQAQREVNLLAARQLYQRRQYSWKTDIQGLIADRGDVVALSHDVTQYDFSGRVVSFSSDGRRIETDVCLPDDIQTIMLRLPNGELIYKEAQKVGNSTLEIQDPLTMDQLPENLNNQDFNNDSEFSRTNPEDYIVFASPRETVGKKVRIKNITYESDDVYTIEAVEEEPAMYSEEYANVNLSENPIELEARVFNISYKNLGSGLVSLKWESQGAFMFRVFSSENPLVPLQTRSGATIFGNNVTLELVEGGVYNLIIDPVLIGSPYEKQKGEIRVEL